MIISHRGRKTGEKENSLSSFEKAIELGAEGIECDARLLPDGEVIISHDKIYKFDDQDLSLDQLFLYIENLPAVRLPGGQGKTGRKVPFFIEVKSSSPILIEKIIKKIEKENLWELVYIIGFSVFIKTALKFQEKYPKLRILQFVNIPLYSFVKPPKKSYGVFLGCIDSWRGSQFLFQKLISQKRLRKLVKLYQNNGFKVMAGVINNEKGLKYFKNSGITDIVTDEIKLALKVFS